MYNAIVSGLGHYAPKHSVSNDDLAKIMDTSDEWIYSRTGIRHRYIAVEETSYEMAAKAAVEALSHTSLKGEELDLIIVATFTGEYATPSMACLVQKALGADKAMCFDVGAACSGFVYGIDVADQFIKTGKFKNALVIGSEKISQILNWEDRGTCVLFGDGAGALVLEQGESGGIISTSNHAMGKDFDCLYAKNKVNKTPFYEGSDEHNLLMNGQEVFQFACTKVPMSIQALMKDHDLTAEDIDYFVLHQANERIIRKIAKRLKVDLSKCFMNMDKYGNTSAASIPIALSEMSEQGLLAGKKVIVAGFGAGLTYGCSLIQF